jgi:hypothetical protein
MRFSILVVCLGLLAGLQAAAASAHEGGYAKFDNCPSTNPEVIKCLYAVTEGGEVVLGNKKVPIVNPVVLQGGYGRADKETHYSPFFEATNGVTLSKAQQPVPGGLLGIVPPEKSPWIVKQLSKFFFENGLTGVNSTLELARPASEIKISEFYQLFETGPALILPVKMHLENPFLGKNCYVGSSSSPIWWNLWTGETEPPPPAEPIHGVAGTPESLEEGGILRYTGTKLVDNAWTAPTASGCGGILSFLVNPIINLMIGLPSTAGHNTAILENTLYSATAKTVNKH